MENQLSKIVIEDGQSIRPFHNYLNETYDQLAGKELSFEGVVFNDRIEYLNHLKGVVELMIKQAEEFKKEDLEGYLESN
jgi:hypothetical protein